MITSLYKEILSRHEQELPVLFDWLDTLGYGMFKKLLDICPTGTLAPTFRHIVYGYSKDSDYVLLESNWSKMKGVIADRVGLKAPFRDTVIKMEDNRLNAVITAYLNEQGDADFKDLKLMEDSYSVIYDNTFSHMNDEEGKFNREGLLGNLAELGKLKKQIKELTADLKDEYAFVYDNLKESEPKKKDRKMNGDVESSQFIQ